MKNAQLFFNLTTSEIREGLAEIEKFPLSTQVEYILTMSSVILKTLNSNRCNIQSIFRLERDFTYGGFVDGYIYWQCVKLVETGDEHVLRLEKEIPELTCFGPTKGERDSVNAEPEMDTMNGVFFNVDKANAEALRGYLYRLIEKAERYEDLAA